MRKTRLPAGGENIFQKVKRETLEAKDRGIEIIKLSIGQPQGPALHSARLSAAEAVMSDLESMHEYQDNGSPGIPDFAMLFIQAHVKTRLDLVEDIGFLPTPGTKPMLGLIPLACGHPHKRITVLTMSDPGYGVPKTWCNYLGVNNYLLPLTSENRFLFSIKDLEGFHEKIDVIMINLPNNPSGQIATKKWLMALCKYCEANDIRLVNDAAYAMLIHAKTKNSSTLADVAINYPNLSWLEFYSASKAIGNGTGWRIGAAIGSKDFIADLKTIKGNTDSGFAAPMAVGVLNAINNDMAGILVYRDLYERRLKVLIKTLTRLGMDLAVKPKAGFFCIFKTPKTAFGKAVDDAEHFNRVMLNNTGVVGVPIGKFYIRYSVAGYPVEENINKISAAFKKANIYR